MRIDMTNNQFNTGKNVNRFGMPMKQQTKPGNSLNVLNQRQNIRQQLRGITNPSGLQTNLPVNSVLDSARSYGEALRAARSKTKTTALDKKKLKYSYKSLSSKIINCKKSYNAKEVISKAKREVARLKKLRSKGEYDSEELEAAIAHAQAMERVAKKKEKHLEEEEMAKAAGGLCMGDLEEKEDTDEISDEELDTENEELSDEELAQMEADEYEYEEFDFSNINSAAQIDAMMSEMFDEMSEEMEELASDMGLDDLLEDMGMSAGGDMDPADLKLMIIKHRNKEMKDMAEADGEYLKAIFDMLEKAKGGSGPNIKMDAPSNASVPSGGADLAQVVNAPVADGAVVSIDVSL